MDAISKGFMSLMEKEVTPNMETIGIPSTTYNGSFEAVIDRLPRTRNTGNSPGFILVVIFTPAALPCIACKALVTGLSSNTFEDILDKEPVTSLLRCDP